MVSFLINPRINPKARAIASDDWHHFVVRIKQRYIYTPAQLIVLITGVLLVTEVEDSPFKMSDTFVLIGFFALVVAVVSGIYFARQGARVGVAYDAGDTGAAESIEQIFRPVGLKTVEGRALRPGLLTSYPESTRKLATRGRCCCR